MGWERSGTSRHERGYGSAWDATRLRILQRDGYACRCPACALLPVPKPATDVDHIISKAIWRRTHGNLDGCDADENLQALNVDCHRRKTAEERGHAYRPRNGADDAGLPLDPDHPWNRESTDRDRIPSQQAKAAIERARRRR